MIPELLKSVFGSITRSALTGIGAYLVSKGVVKGADVETLIVGAGMALTSLVWSLWQKYKGRLNFLVALSLPSNSTEADVKRAVNHANDVSVW